MQTNGLCLIENTVTVVLSERKVINEGLKAAEDLIVCRCALVLPWSFDAAPRGFKLLTVVCVRCSQFPGVVFPNRPPGLSRIRCAFAVGAGGVEGAAYIKNNMFT